MFTTIAMADPPKTPTPQQREAVRQGATLTVIAIAAILVIGGFALVLLARYRRTVLERRSRKAKKTRPKPDAWAESAKRLRTDGGEDTGGGADDDTVDIDPSDLSPRDIGGGPESGEWKP